MLTKEVWLIKNLKNSLGLLICCGGCADLMPFSTNLCQKSIFIKKFGGFLFCFFYSNLGLPSAKSLQNERLVSCPPRRKIEPVTTLKIASYLMDMNIIFQENMCLTDLNHYKHSKMTIFEYTLTQKRMGTVFSGVQPEWPRIVISFENKISWENHVLKVTVQLLFRCGEMYSSMVLENVLQFFTWYFRDFTFVICFQYFSIFSVSQTFVLSEKSDFIQPMTLLNCIDKVLFVKDKSRLYQLNVGEQ